MAALGSKYFTNSKAAYFQLPGGSAAKPDGGGGADKSSSPPAADTPEITEKPASAPASSAENAATEQNSP